jgi:TolC family type I secretion outer membrane protein
MTLFGALMGGASNAADFSDAAQPPGSDGSSQTQMAGLPEAVSQAAAEQRDKPKVDSVSFTADEVLYDNDLGVATARGPVEFSHGERLLRADQISYNLRKEVVIAAGNVSIVEPSGEVVFADRLDLTGDMKNGLAQEMRTVLGDRLRVAERAVEPEVKSGSTSSEAKTESVAEAKTESVAEAKTELKTESRAASVLAQGLERVLNEHPLMRSVDKDVAAAKEQIGVDRSSWFPQLSFRASGGKQHVDRDATLDSNNTMRTLYTPKEVGVTANQLIWDFGTVNANINRSQMNHTKEQMERLTQRTNLVLAGIDAHLKLFKARQQFEYAVKSEANIKQQAQLESARIDAGKGLSTDLLQAKAQLAGAQARRVAAQAAVDTATNRYRAVFGNDNIPPQLEWVNEPVVALPPSLEDALRLAENQNPDVIAARSRADLKEAESKAIRNKEWMPKLSLQYDGSEKSNNDGTAGTRKDQKVLMQATWQFDTGLKAKFATDAAALAAASGRETSYYSGLQASEETENAWTDLKAARERLDYLNDQVEISLRFLELARKEREFGKRSLLDVLSGETNLINAQSEAAAAETDVVLASFRMLRAIGALDLTHVVAAPPKPPAASALPVRTSDKEPAPVKASAKAPAKKAKPVKAEVAGTQVKADAGKQIMNP